jgi:hypothetical protein
MPQIETKRPSQPPSRATAEPVVWMDRPQNTTARYTTSHAAHKAKVGPAGGGAHVRRGASGTPLVGVVHDKVDAIVSSAVVYDKVYDAGGRGTNCFVNFVVN